MFHVFHRVAYFADTAGKPANRTGNARFCTRRSVSIITAALAILATAVLPAAAASNVMDLSLDQLLEVNVDKVYGASKFEQKVTQAPSSVSLVTRDEIQKQGHRTLADVLRSVNGLFVSDDRNYSYLGIRGFNRPSDYNSRVLLLVDGHRMNDNIFEQALFGTEAFLDVDDVERVEVIRGPSSSIYGNNAFFGVVNIMTRRGRDLNGLETTVEAGDNATYKTGARFGKLFSNDVELYLAGSWFESDGERSIFFPEFNSPTNNNGVARDSDADRAGHFLGSLGFHDFTVSGGWSWREKTVPTASFESAFNDKGEKTEDERGYVDVKFDRELDTDTHVTARTSYDWAKYWGEYPYGTGVDRVLNLDEAAGRWLSADLQLTHRVADRHTFIIGGDFRENLRMHQHNFDEASGPTYLDDDRDGHNSGVFAQAEIGLLTNLLLNAGARYDCYSTFGHTLNPRLGLLWNPAPKTTLKLLYGRAFRAPNAYELFYSYTNQAKANPDLEAETIHTYEAVWEQYLPHNLRLSVAGFHYDVKNLISQQMDTGDSLLVFQNTDRASATGLEVELEHRHASGLIARTSYAWQRAEDDATGDELSNSPRNIAKLNLIVPICKDRLFAGAELQYYGRVRTVAATRSDDILLANFTLLSRPVGENLEFSASIYNLTDERDGFSGSFDHLQETIPMPGRSFRVKLTWRF